MKDLQSFFENPFRDERLTLSSKQKFGEDMIERISAQNTLNQYDDMLNSTVAVQTSLFGAITSVLTTAAIQQSRTQSVDNIINQFTTRNTRLNKVLDLAGVVGTPVYQEFFPYGVTAMTRDINKSNIGPLMDQMITAIINHTAAAGGAPVLAEYQAIKTAYTAARSAQLGKIGEVSGQRNDRNAVEAEWNDKMFSNLLTIANLNRDQPGKITSFMNQSILRTKTYAASDGKGRITGHVSSGGLSQAGVRVHVVDGNIADATTDSAGNYSTQYLPVGSYEVIYSKDGLTSKTETWDVEDEGDTIGNISLVDPTPEPVEERKVKTMSESEFETIKEFTECSKRMN